MVLGLVLASPLAAQWRGHLQLGGGLTISTGVFKEDGGKSGWIAQVAAGAMSRGGILGGRISGTYAKHDFASATGSFKISGAMGDVLVASRSTGRAFLYGLAGLGLQNINAGPGSQQTRFAWNLGAGGVVRARRIGFFIEGRFLSIQSEGQKTNTIPITAGLRLGGR
jgi:hypothetical protein